MTDLFLSIITSPWTTLAAGTFMGFKLKGLMSPPNPLTDHMTLYVKTKKDVTTYVALVKPLGGQAFYPMFDGAVVGMGRVHPGGDFWVSSPPNGEPARESISPAHVGFAAYSRADVDAWYDNALQLGFVDNGCPGVRPEYHPNYYAAFVTDPETGHNLEAVCHIPVMPFGYVGRVGPAKTK